MRKKLAINSEGLLRYFKHCDFHLRAIPDTPNFQPPKWIRQVSNLLLCC